MAFSDLTSPPQVDRIGRTDRHDDRRLGKQIPSRPKARVRTVVEIGASFSVILLIMVGALVVRILASLPFTH